LYFKYIVSQNVYRKTSSYILVSQLIRFARVCNKVEDFNDRNSIFSRKLLKQGFLFHKPRKTFAKLYNRHFDLVEQFNSFLINLIEGGISHPHFCGEFLKKIKKVKNKTNGVSLQQTVSLITQDFLNRKYNKHILKNTCSLVLISETMANIPILL